MKLSVTLAVTLAELDGDVDTDCATLDDGDNDCVPVSEAVTDGVHDTEAVLLAEMEAEPVEELVAVVVAAELLDIDGNADALAVRVGDEEGSGEGLKVQLALNDAVTEVVTELDRVTVWVTVFECDCEDVADSEAVEVIVDATDVDKTKLELIEAAKLAEVE